MPFRFALLIAFFAAFSLSYFHAGRHAGLRRFSLFIDFRCHPVMPACHAFAMLMPLPCCYACCHATLLIDAFADAIQFFSLMLIIFRFIFFFSPLHDALFICLLIILPFCHTPVFIVVITPRFTLPPCCCYACRCCRHFFRYFFFFFHARYCHASDARCC